MNHWTGNKDAKRSEARAQLAMTLVGSSASETRANCIEGRSPATANRLLSAISVVQRAAEDSGGPRAQRLKRFREPESRSRVLTVEEEAALCGFSPLAAGLLDSGMRAAEFLTCSMDGLIVDSKNGSTRKVPLTERAKAALRSRPRSYQTLYRRIVRSCEELGIEGVTPHTLRHTRITRLVAQGVPLAVVQRFAGHSDIATTLRYTHLSDETIEEYIL